MALLIPLALGIVIVGVSVRPIVRRFKSRYRPAPPPEASPPSPSGPAVEPTAVILMDRLDRIEGMTSGMAHDLNQAGILTYADLAALPPEHLSAIVNPTPHHDGQGSMTIAVTDWITQAQALADHLRHGATPPAP